MFKPLRIFLAVALVVLIVGLCAFAGHPMPKVNPDADRVQNGNPPPICNPDAERCPGGTQLPAPPQPPTHS